MTGILIGMGSENLEESGGLTLSCSVMDASDWAVFASASWNIRFILSEQNVKGTMQVRNDLTGRNFTFS